MNFSDATASEDGKKIFAIGASERAELVRYNASTKAFAPFLPSVSAEGVSFSPDGQWLTYVAYPEGTLWKSNSDGRSNFQLTFPPLRALLPRVSPDGQKIAFSGTTGNNLWKIYVIPSEGGPPQELIPGEQQFDPSWASDGKSLVYGTNPGFEGGQVDIRVFDLETRKISKLPDSNGLFSPRCSPAGRYIAALTADHHDLVIFDLQSQSWRRLAGPDVNYPSFSRRGTHIYFQDWHSFSHSEGKVPGQVSISRIQVSDGKVQKIFEIESLASLAVGTIMPWSGLGPDDSPLLARDISSQEIYSLEAGSH